MDVSGVFSLLTVLPVLVSQPPSPPPARRGPRTTTTFNSNTTRRLRRVAHGKLCPLPTSTRARIEWLAPQNLRAVYDRNGAKTTNKKGGIGMEDAAGFLASGEWFKDYVSLPPCVHTTAHRRHLHRLVRSCS